MLGAGVLGLTVSRWRQRSLLVAAVGLGLLGVVEAVRIAIVRFALDDFRLYYAAAQVGLADGFSRIYDAGLERAAVAALTPGGDWFPYLNPPPLAWLAAPFTLLPFTAAFAVWFVLILIAVVGAGFLAAPSDGRARLLFIGLGLGLFPTAWALGAGQVVPLLMLALVAAWRLLKAERQVLAGVVLAATVLKPQLTLLVPFCLLASGRPQVFLAWAGTAGVLAALSLATLGEHGMRQYLEALGGASIFFQERRWALTTFLGPAGIYAQVAVALVALAAAFRHRRPGVEVPILAGVVGSVLASPYFNAPDFAILAAAGWIWARGDAFTGRAWLLGLAFLTVEFAQAIEIPVLTVEAAILLALVLVGPAGRPAEAPVAA